MPVNEVSFPLPKDIVLLLDHSGVYCISLLYECEPSLLVKPKESPEILC